jgi:dihydroorotase
MQQKFLPDTISSDLTAAGRTNGVFDFPTVLSKFLMLGMPLDQVIARGTVNAAHAISEFKAYGTLRPGAAADVAVFDLKDGDFEFVDNFNAKRIGHRKLIPYAAIAGGKRFQA